MKWPHPLIGQIRVRRRFAWLPTRIDCWTVWLQHYWVQEIYSERHYGTIWVPSVTSIHLITLDSPAPPPSE